MLSDDDCVLLVMDLQGICDQLMNLVNSIDGNGCYIFVGYKMEVVLFDQVIGGYYGGEKSVIQQVDFVCMMVIGYMGV